jgi:hypothetical protein
MMAKNLFCLEFILDLKVWILAICFLSVAACSSGTPSHSERFSLELGKKRLEIVVNKYCTYEIGISFLAKDGGQLIKDTFGVATELKMPVLIDIVLENKDGQVVFSKIDFGGTGLGYRYGPNPVKFIAGKAYLEPGKNTVTIYVRHIDQDLSKFDTEIFVSGDPKLTCEKKN